MSDSNGAAGPARHGSDPAGPALFGNSAPNPVNRMPGTRTVRTARRLTLVGVLLALIGLGVWLTRDHFLAEHHIGQAARALQKQRYPQALAEYREALRYRPRSALLHLLAGRIARQAGDLAAAREELRRCRELQNGVSEEQQVEEYLVRVQSGELEEVYPYLLPYRLQEGPLTPLVLEALVRAFMGKYRMEPAWDCLSRWLELEPDNVEAHVRRGMWFTQQQSTTEAIASYRSALERDPERTDARLACAELMHLGKRNTAQVAEQYEIVLSQSPGNPTALIGLAQCRLESGQPDEARALLDALPEDRQKTGDALWVRGMIELQANRPEAAEGYLRQALAREPRHVEAMYNLMLCLGRLGRAEEARAMNERLEQVEKDHKRLVTLITHELYASPHNPEAACELGEVYMRLGVPDRGLYWLQTALKIDPGCRRAHERLRDYYDSLGPDARDKAEFHRRQLASR